MQDPSASNEELLKARAPSEASDALAEFYRRNERIVMAFYMRRVHDSEVAADLTAVVFLEVLKSRDRFHGETPGDATAWLFAIANHVLSRHTRRQTAESRRQARMLRELPALSDEQAVEIDLLAEEGPLTAALATLPATQREAVRAYVLGERTYSEIAQQSQIEPSAVRKRVSRGLRTLRAGHKESQ